MATREELKSYFETDDIPTQEQFWELIDSMAIVGEDNSGSVSAIIGQSWNNTQKALARANIGFDDALDDWIVTWDSIEAGALPLDRLPSVVGRKDQANTWALAQTFNGDVSIPNDGTYGGIAIRRASGRTGFLQMSKPDGTRQGYIGFDNGNDISFTNEQSGIFAFNKGATFNGNISQTNGTDTYQTSIGVPGNYDGYLRILRNGVLKALIGGDGADDLDFTVVSDLALLGATSKVRPFEHQNSWLEFKGSGKRNVELHAWDVLTLGTNFTTRLTIDADGNSTFNGNISAAGGIAVSGKIQISNNGSNFGSTLSNGSSQFYNSSTVGLVIAGAGSTSDLTVTNKAGGDVFSIPTGTTNVDFTGAVSALSLNADVGSDKPLRSYRGATYSGWINGSAIYDQESWYMGDGAHYFAVGATNILEVNAAGINVAGNVTVNADNIYGKSLLLTDSIRLASTLAAWSPGHLYAKDYDLVVAGHLGISFRINTGNVYGGTEVARISDTGAATFNGPVGVTNGTIGRVGYGPDSYIEADANELKIYQAGSGSAYVDFGNSTIFRRTSDFATMARLTNDGRFIVNGIGASAPADLILGNSVVPWFTRVRHNVDWARTELLNNYVGDATYGGWQFQNLVGSTITTKAEIKGNGDLVANAATFNGAIDVASVYSPAFRHKNTANEYPWMLYSPGIDQSWYIRDIVNSRMQITFTPGASASAAVTQIHSQLVVEGAATFNGTVKISKGDANADSYGNRVDSLVFSRGDLPTSYLNKITNSFSATPGSTTMSFELGDGSGSGYVIPLTLRGDGSATFNGNMGIGVTPTAQLDMSGGYLRVRGGAGGGAVPTNSKGLELTFDSTTDIGYVFAVSRDGAGAYPLSIGPTANPLYIAANGNVTANGSTKLGIKTIATLPSAASSSGERYQVSDSATIANRIVFSDGSAWYYEGTAVAV